MALVKPQVEDRGIVTDLSAVPELEATVDGDHLQQAMMNLLLNAIDAAGRGGHIRVSAQRNDGHVEIDVKDSGPGLGSERAGAAVRGVLHDQEFGNGNGSGRYAHASRKNGREHRVRRVRSGSAFPDSAAHGGAREWLGFSLSKTSPPP